MERKCTREKQRRNEFNEGLGRLSEFLCQVEPSLRSGKSKGDDVRETITNRSELIQVTVRVITRLHNESEQLKAQVAGRCQQNTSLRMMARVPTAKDPEPTLAANALIPPANHPRPTSARVPEWERSNSTALPLEHNLYSALLQEQRLLSFQQMRHQSAAGNSASTANHLAIQPLGRQHSTSRLPQFSQLPNMPPTRGSFDDVKEGNNQAEPNHDADAGNQGGGG